MKLKSIRYSFIIPRIFLILLNVEISFCLNLTKKDNQACCMIIQSSQHNHRNTSYNLYIVEVSPKVSKYIYFFQQKK